MKQEEKELLLKDLCARLPYDVMVDYESYIYILNEIDPACKDIDYITVRIQDVERSMCAINVMIENIKPYLRPMSSMTEEEVEELNNIVDKELKDSEPYFVYEQLTVDFYLSHHLDNRLMIEKGLALEAPKDMYNIK